MSSDSDIQKHMTRIQNELFPNDSYYALILEIFVLQTDLTTILLMKVFTEENFKAELSFESWKLHFSRYVFGPRCDISTER